MEVVLKFFQGFINMGGEYIITIRHRDLRYFLWNEDR